MTDTTTATPTYDATGSLLGVHDTYAPSQAGFGLAFVDQDERLDVPVPHRLVHGGFADTQTLFTLYLPLPEQYDGRLLQFLEGGAGGHENLLAANAHGYGVESAPWQYEFAFDEMGAVLVESNQGHFPNTGNGFHNDIHLFGASAETARFAKWLAARIYGAEVHHAYVFGASGGGHRSFQCIMRAPDVYDGGVPEVFGVNPAPYWSVMGHAVFTLGREIKKVRDALEPGGSGDPFDGLSYAQREALRDIFHYGYPRRATTQLSNMPVFPFALYNVLEHNPDYFRAFWNDRGYLGADDPARLAERVFQVTTTAREIAPASSLTSELVVMMQLATAGATPQSPYGLRTELDEPRRALMAKLTVRTGKAAGREMVIASVTRDGVLVPFSEMCPELFTDVEPGDEIEIDNRDWVAFCHMYQHDVEWNVPGLHSDEQRVPGDYDRFAVDGNPVYPQTGTSVYDLNEVVPFPGKMIYIGATLDVAIWPTKVTLFDEYVRQVLDDTADDHYRFWWVENSTHGRAEMGSMADGAPGEVWRTRLVDYEAVSASALVAVRDWVERGVEPPASTSYSYTADKELVLPDSAAERGGVQPVVRLRVDGGTRVDVKVGAEVTFEGAGEVPPGGGSIVEAAIDFDSSDTWSFQSPAADGSAESIAVTATHVFDAPGTYFPSFRVGAHRDGAGFRGEAVRNLARVRVVVSE
jgi:hypothetical protein